MHHATKKSLVAKYLEMKTGGASDEQLREALDQEEKVESKEDADEIMAALSEPPPPEGNNPPTPPAPPKAKAKYVVESEFRDINNFLKVHEVGDDVSHFDKQRLETLLANGQVVKK